MRTYTGRYVDPLNLRPEDICIEDIAHALAHQCRYAGMCVHHYSVAQHSTYCVDYVDSALKRSDLALATLLHDAAEAYLTDLPRPLKRLPQFAFYREAEDRALKVIFQALNVNADIHDPVVKQADNAILVAEGIQIMNELYTEFGLPARIHIDEMTPRDAEIQFLKYYQAALYVQAATLDKAFKGLDPAQAH